MFIYLKPGLRATLSVVFLILTACGSGSSEKQTDVVILPPVSLPVAERQLAIPDNRYADSYNVLLVGNSHVRANDLPEVLKMLLETRSNKAVTVQLAPGGSYLDERMSDTTTVAAIQSANWNYIILQGQKYSTSGQYSYPTEATEYWVALSKTYRATPVLFPEHPRQGNAGEGRRVYALHLGIAEQEPACVAPLGPAWDNARETLPQVALHSDGNHASLAGTLLTALLFYQIISGENADELPYLPQLALSESLQSELGQLVSLTLQQYDACQY